MRKVRLVHWPAFIMCMRSQLLRFMAITPAALNEHKPTFVAEMTCWCRWRSRLAALTAMYTICSVMCASGASTVTIWEIGAYWLFVAPMTVPGKMKVRINVHR